MKFDRSRACSLCHSPANLLSGSLCVQTYELTLRIALHARLHVRFVHVNKTFANLLKRASSYLANKKSYFEHLLRFTNFFFCYNITFLSIVLSLAFLFLVPNEVTFEILYIHWSQFDLIVHSEG